MKQQKIYAEILEESALSQFNDAMAQSFVIKGALMPDAHTGYTLPIGAVVACEDVIVPAYVGYDIGCGMGALKTSFNKQDILDNREAIFNQIYADVPVGFKTNTEHQLDSSWSYKSKSEWLEEHYSRKHIQQLGTLGGGNHFIEIGADEHDAIWIIVHSGSRNLGHNVASKYMALASDSEKPKEGHYPLSVRSKEGSDYIKDMKFCLSYALINRQRILQAVCFSIAKYCKLEDSPSEFINRNHNHAEINADGLWIHRKGATHAEKGMMGVIPGNMRDGSFIVRGKGCAESLCSSSHGAGRVMGRFKAKRTFTMSEFKEKMTEVTAKVCEDTLDESPMAYKDIFEVMKQQKDLVEVVAHVKPIINVKG